MSEQDPAIRHVGSREFSKERSEPKFRPLEPGLGVHASSSRAGPDGLRQGIGRPTANDADLGRDCPAEMP
jgi:hypothetical protein